MNALAYLKGHGLTWITDPSQFQGSDSNCKLFLKDLIKVNMNPVRLPITRWQTTLHPYAVTELIESKIHYLYKLGINKYLGLIELNSDDLDYVDDGGYQGYNEFEVVYIPDLDVNVRNCEFILINSYGLNLENSWMGKLPYWNSEFKLNLQFPQKDLIVKSKCLSVLLAQKDADEVINFTDQLPDSIEISESRYWMKGLLNNLNEIEGRIDNPNFQDELVDTLRTMTSITDNLLSNLKFDDESPVITYVDQFGILKWEYKDNYDYLDFIQLHLKLDYFDEISNPVTLNYSIISPTGFTSPLEGSIKYSMICNHHRVFFIELLDTKLIVVAHPDEHDFTKQIRLSMLTIDPRFTNKLSSYKFLEFNYVSLYKCKCKLTFKLKN